MLFFETQCSNLGPISFHPCDEQMDRQTDRWTDRIVMAKMRWKQ